VAGDLATWERHEEIQHLATWWSSTVPAPGTRRARRRGWRVVEVTVPNLEISSTDLRARAADGRPLDYLVPLLLGLQWLGDQGTASSAPISTTYSLISEVQPS
jgi:nicotinic acid mononucleotide adenylyltransferase